MGWFSTAAVEGLKGLVSGAPAALLNMGGGLFGARKQYKHNRALAAQQHRYNKDLLQEQLEYNSPKAQMERFKEANLNPHLVYSQGNPGNQGAPLSYPNVQPSDYQSMFSNVGTQLMQMKLMQAQSNLTNTKVEESTVKQDLMKAQRDLVKANPYLNESYVNAMVLQLQSTARIKEQEATIQPINQAKAIEKIQAEINLLSQKFNLGALDAQIKAKVVTSKEFQNTLQEIQVKWMQDKEITPQHIYMGIMLMLQKLM